MSIIQSINSNLQHQYEQMKSFREEYDQKHSRQVAENDTSNRLRDEVEVGKANENTHIDEKVKGNTQNFGPAVKDDVNYRGIEMLNKFKEDAELQDKAMNMELEKTALENIMDSANKLKESINDDNLSSDEKGEVLKNVASKIKEDLSKVVQHSEDHQFAEQIKENVEEFITNAKDFIQGIFSKSKSSQKGNGAENATSSNVKNSLNTSNVVVSTNGKDNSKVEVMSSQNDATADKETLSNENDVVSNSNSNDNRNLQGAVMSSKQDNGANKGTVPNENSSAAQLNGNGKNAHGVEMSSKKGNGKNKGVDSNEEGSSSTEEVGSTTHGEISNSERTSLEQGNDTQGTDSSKEGIASSTNETTTYEETNVSQQGTISNEDLSPSIEGVSSTTHGEILNGESNSLEQGNTTQGTDSSEEGVASSTNLTTTQEGTNVSQQGTVINEGNTQTFDLTHKVEEVGSTGVQQEELEQAHVTTNDDIVTSTEETSTREGNNVSQQENNINDGNASTSSDVSNEGDKVDSFNGNDNSQQGHETISDTSSYGANMPTQADTKVNGEDKETAPNENISTQQNGDVKEKEHVSNGDNKSEEGNTSNKDVDTHNTESTSKTDNTSSEKEQKTTSKQDDTTKDTDKTSKRSVINNDNIYSQDFVRSLNNRITKLENELHGIRGWKGNYPVGVTNQKEANNLLALLFENLLNNPMHYLNSMFVFNNDRRENVNKLLK